MKSHKERYLPATNEPTDNDSYLEKELESTNSNDSGPYFKSFGLFQEEDSLIIVPKSKVS